MSRAQQARNLQRETKNERTLTEGEGEGVVGEKEKYAPYFYRDGPANNNVSPSPSSSNANTIAISKSKDSKKMKATRLIAKNNNSNIYGSINKKYGQEQFLALKKENKELRNQIVELKVNQFYQFDNNKLKDLIADVERLKAEVLRLKEENEMLKLENDFLNRTNFQLKNQRLGLMETTTDKKIKLKEAEETFFQHVHLKTQPKEAKKQILNSYPSEKGLKTGSPHIESAKTLNARKQMQKAQLDNDYKISGRREKSNLKGMSRAEEEKLLQKYLNLNRKKIVNSEGSQGQL